MSRSRRGLDEAFIDADVSCMGLVLVVTIMHTRGMDLLWRGLLMIARRNGAARGVVAKRWRCAVCYDACSRVLLRRFAPDTSPVSPHNPPNVLILTTTTTGCWWSQGGRLVERQPAVPQQQRRRPRRRRRRAPRPRPRPRRRPRLAALDPRAQRAAGRAARRARGRRVGRRVRRRGAARVAARQPRVPAVPGRVAAAAVL